MVVNLNGAIPQIETGASILGIWVMFTPFTSDPNASVSSAIAKSETSPTKVKLDESGRRSPKSRREQIKVGQSTGTFTGSWMLNSQCNAVFSDLRIM